MINFRGILNHLKKLFQKHKMSEIDQLSKIRNKPIIIILGCTGTGKTKLSIELAKKYKGEIINADALQLYKGLDIATNKATSEEMSNIPHNLIAYLDPMNKNYTVKDYQKKAIELVSFMLYLISVI
jgi:tRNA A37 N6-isopentenylltransferase MiaA